MQPRLEKRGIGSYELVISVKSIPNLNCCYINKVSVTRPPRTSNTVNNAIIIYSLSPLFKMLLYGLIVELKAHTPQTLCSVDYFITDFIFIITSQ